MLRNTLIYHRWWHYRRRNSGQLSIAVFLFSSIIILMLAVSYSENKILPHMLDISEYKARASITRIMNEAVSKEFSEDITYEDLVDIIKDKNNRITAVHTNIDRMNKISTGVNEKIRDMLSSFSEGKMKVPAGALLDSSMFSEMGPGIPVNVVQAGNTETAFQSEFSSVGLNQTRHVIFLNVKTRVEISVLLSKKETEAEVQIPVAETIIVGDIPEIV